MADVRLTAVNPEDSQVYPVACNDKGELLLDSGGASGDLDVAGNLTVAGSATFAGVITGDTDTTYLPIGTITDSLFLRGNDIVFTSQDGGDHYGHFDTAGALRIGGDATANNAVIDANGAANFAETVSTGSFPNDASTSAGGGAYLARQDTSTSVVWKAFNGGTTTSNVTSQILADGSATFAKDVRIGGFDLSNPSASGIEVRGTGEVIIQRVSGQDNAAALDCRLGSTQTALIQAGGSATFAGTVKSESTSGTFSALNNGYIVIQDSAADATTIFLRARTAPGNEQIELRGDGSATFAGNVTAPNINFKLAPATVASMPTPLIDEGFAADQSVDLLSELIKMKLQIRDLNEFMQRSIQDDPET